MKRYLFKYVAAASIVALSSCELDTEDISRITHFPNFTLAGDALILLPAGEPFTDPGATAEEGGNPIDVDVAISGTYFSGNVSSIDTNAPDRYDITYSAINSDGFPGTTQRTVFVAGKGNLTDDISGLYTSTIVRNGVVSAQYQDLGYVIIRKTGASTYVLSDIIAGYYDLGRGFGPDYAGPSSTVTVNNLATDDFTFGPPVGIGLFGGNAEITSMEVDESSKQIHMVTEWDFGFTFDIVLTQVEF